MVFMKNECKCEKSLGLNLSKKFCHQPPKTIGCPCWLCQFCHLFLPVLSMHTLGGSCRLNAVLCHRTSNSDFGSDCSSSFCWWPSNRLWCRKRCLANSWVAGWWKTTTATCPQAENVITYKVSFGLFLLIHWGTNFYAHHTFPRA